MGKIPWRKKWQPTPVFLPGKSHGQRSLAGYSPWGCRVGHDLATEDTSLHTSSEEGGMSSRREDTFKAASEPDTEGQKGGKDRHGRKCKCRDMAAGCKLRRYGCRLQSAEIWLQGAKCGDMAAGCKVRRYGCRMQSAEIWLQDAKDLPRGEEVNLLGD